MYSYVLCLCASVYFICAFVVCARARVCVYVCSFSVCMCACMSVYMYVYVLCMCVCTCAWVCAIYSVYIKVMFVYGSAKCLFRYIFDVP